MDWFRCWHGLSTDAKFLVVMQSTGCDGAQALGVLVALFDHASQARPRGSIKDFDPQSYSAFAQTPAGLVENLVRAFGPSGPLARPVHDGEQLISWEKRQPKKVDATAAERQRRKREKEGAKPGKPAAKRPNASRRVTGVTGRDGEGEGLGGEPVTLSRHVTPLEEIQSEALDLRTSLATDTSTSSASGDAHAHTRTRGMPPNQVLTTLAEGGVHLSVIQRTFRASALAKLAELTREQLLAACDLARQARVRDQDPSPVNVGFLLTFVPRVLGTDPNPKTRSPGHERVDAAADAYLAQR